MVEIVDSKGYYYYEIINNTENFRYNNRTDSFARIVVIFLPVSRVKGILPLPSPRVVKTFIAFSRNRIRKIFTEAHFEFSQFARIHVYVNSLSTPSPRV